MLGVMTTHALYTKKCIDDSYVILILYVDGMLIVGRNKDELSKQKINWNQTSDMKNLGNAKHIFGMCITQDEQWMYLFVSIGVCIQNTHEVLYGECKAFDHTIIYAC